MMTVYKYGFTAPTPVKVEPQGPGIMQYALLFGVMYLAWSSGLIKKLGTLGMPKDTEGGAQ